MKLKLSGIAVGCLTLILTATIHARPRQTASNTGRLSNSNAPIKLLGAILLPGKPLRFDISWVDQKTGRYYLAEAGNAAVDVFDAENDLYLGRITGFHGPGSQGGPCGIIEGMGPNGVLVTPDEHLWADDAPGRVMVFDLSHAQPPFRNLRPVATISTGAKCRADEIGYDPKDHVMVVGNPEEKPPFAVVISSEAPYTLLSKIPFPGADGIEQALWDPELNGGRMLLSVPGKGEGETSKIVVFDLSNPKTPKIETTYSTPGCGSGLALGPSQRLLVGCEGGRPLLIINALTGKTITHVAGTHGADEVWYNAGDNHFYAASGFGAHPVLNIIDASTGKLLNTQPAGPLSHSVAAYEGNNHVFVPIGPPFPRAPRDTCNILLGMPANRGCIAVYGHRN